MVCLVCLEARAMDLNLEAGAAWFSRNDARIRGDTGTKFDLLELTGSGPVAYSRVHASRRLGARHALRLTLAPFEADGKGTLDRDVLFKETTFPRDRRTYGRFRFNTYRLTYRYTVIENERQHWAIGGAALIRDAEIRLEQNDRSARRDDLGIVPLLHGYGEVFLSDRLSVLVDVEGAGSPQGRAIDATLQLRYGTVEGWQAALGYRTLEGGADNDAVYTFAWIHYALVSIGRQF